MPKGKNMTSLNVNNFNIQHFNQPNAEASSCKEWPDL